MLERRHNVCVCVVCQYIISTIKYEILIVTVFNNYQMRFALNDNAQFEVKLYSI